MCAPRVTLFSYHYLNSRRKAGFHWLAESCWRLGWDVVFVTAPISKLSRLKRDFRFEYPVVRDANQLIPVRERLASYVLYSTLHPVGSPLSWVNWLSTPLVARYARLPLGDLAEIVARSNVIIMESTPALLLTQQLRGLNPHGRLVYRASDDLTFANLKTHPKVLAAEASLAAEFDLISAASRITADRLRSAKATYHPHGIAKHLFDGAQRSPYTGGPNVVWVGTRWMDDVFLEAAANQLPSWNFHIIGPVPRSVEQANVHYYGELPFESTVPLVRHADVGLSTFPTIAVGDRSRETMSIHSLKTTQYTYCGLPIVAPHDLVIDRPNVFSYDMKEPASVGRALTAAVSAGRHPEMGRDVWSWDDLALTLLSS